MMHDPFFFTQPKMKTLLKINKGIMLPCTLFAHLIPILLLTGRLELVSGSHPPNTPASIPPTDVCANCRGDNSSCRVVAGIFTRPQLTVGYNVVAHIPRGACNLNISEIRNSPNHLALRRKNGSYIFNGDWRLSQSGVYEGPPGTKVIYKRQDLKSLESITSDGVPLEEALDLLVLYQQPNPGIRYQFSVPASSWKESSLQPLVPFAQNQAHWDEMRYYHNRRQSLAATSRTASYISPDESSLSSPTSTSLQQLPQPILNLYNSVSAFPAKNNNNHFASSGGGSSPDLYTPAAGDLSSLSSYNSHNNGANNNNPNNLYNHHHHHNHLSRRRNHGGGIGNKHPVLASGGSGSSAILPNAIDKKFYWKIAGYSNCSEPCGGGIQRSIVRCVRGTTGNGVSDRRCFGEEKPPTQLIRCNVKPCPAEWVIGEWSSCNGECGLGQKIRTIHCQQRVSPRLTRMSVAEGACLKQKPEATLQCQLKPCNHWNTSEWSQCGTPCGNSVRKRSVTCIGPSGKEIPGEECDQTEKPAEVTPCNMGSCIGVSWFVSEWSGCSEKCGSGIQTRHVVCSGLHNHKAHKPNDTDSSQQHKNRYYSYEHHHHSKNGTINIASELETNLIEDDNSDNDNPEKDFESRSSMNEKMDDNKILEANSDQSAVIQFEGEKYALLESQGEQYFCDESQKPDGERVCFSDRGCGDPVWFIGDWGECSSSSSCGSGIRTRQILCVLFTRGRFKILSNSGHCPDKTKPIEKETCKSYKECKHRWFTSEWDECSALCGGGIQTRRVSCRAKNWTLSSSLCSDEDRPVEKRSCNEQKCTLNPVILATQSPQISSSNISKEHETVKDEPEAKVMEDYKTEGNGTLTQKESEPQHNIQQTSPVHEEEVDEIECIDEYRNCALVVQARLCRYKYYKSVCCHSCSDAPF